ncbi:unnamed protein product, partial [Staurois parvus]
VTLAVESGLSTAPTQLSRDIGLTGHRAHGTQWDLGCGVWPQHSLLGTIQGTGGLCTQQGQFRKRVVCAHNRESSGHGWSVHTIGTVHDTGGLCAQQRQFRTWVVLCAQQAQFR